MAVYVDYDKCMGCGLCQVYCQTEHSQTKDIIKAHKRENPRSSPRVQVERWNGDWLAVQCRHCTEPWCVYSCLTGAMSKDPVSGIVTSDPEKCIGCWTCILACPYGVLSRDMAQHVVLKCDLCPDHEIPVCVANCPNEALTLVEEKAGKTTQPTVQR